MFGEIQMASPYSAGFNAKLTVHYSTEDTGRASVSGSLGKAEAIEESPKLRLRLTYEVVGHAGADAQKEEGNGNSSGAQVLSQL